MIDIGNNTWIEPELNEPITINECLRRIKERNFTELILVDYDEFAEFIGLSIGASEGWNKSILNPKFYDVPVVILEDKKNKENAEMHTIGGI